MVPPEGAEGEPQVASRKCKKRPMETAARSGAVVSGEEWPARGSTTEPALHSPTSDPCRAPQPA